MGACTACTSYKQFRDIETQPLFPKQKIKHHRGECVVYGYCREMEQKDNWLYLIPWNVAEEVLDYYGEHSDVIPLQIHSHRGHYDNLESYHPVSLLNRDQCFYWSQSQTTFKPKEKDWIVFACDRPYLPMQINIVNGDLDCGVRHLQLSIGDGDQWVLASPNMFTLQRSKQCQMFEIEGLQPKTIKRNRFTLIKVEFCSNQREWRNGPKYAVNHIKIYGVPL